MATKKILFDIEINGSQAAIRNATDLKLAIGEIEKQLKKKTITDNSVYDRLEKQALELRATLKTVQQEQQQTIRQFQANAAPEGSYVRLNQELNKLRTQFKELSAVERQSQIGKDLIGRIGTLDKELKNIDASLGQFQRNVGNYQTSLGQLRDAIGGLIPGFGQLGRATSLFNQGIGQMGATATSTGKILTSAFVGFQVLGLLLQGVQAIGDFTAEMVKLQGQIQRTSVAFNDLNTAAAEVQATANTFGQDVGDVLLSATNLANAFNISLEDATGIIQEGFLNGADSGREFLDVLREYPRLFEQAGFSAQEFVDIQTLAAQEGIYSDKGVDAVKEFGIRIREQTTATTLALREAFGKEFTDELFGGINDGSITTRDALVRVSKALNDTEIPAKQLQQVISDTFGGPGEDAGDEFLRSLAQIETGLVNTAEATNQLTERQREQLNAERELALAKAELTQATADLTAGTATLGTQLQTGLVRAFTAVINVGRNVIGVFNGVEEARKQFLVNFTNLVADVINQGKILALELAKLNPLADGSALQAQIDDIGEARKRIAANGRSLGEAFREGFNDIVGARGTVTRGVDAEEERRRLEQQRIEGEKQRKEREAAAKAAAEKEAAERERLFAAAQAAEQRYADQRLALLNELAKRLVDATLQNIADQEAAEIAAENVRFDRVLSELKENEEQYVKTITESRAAIVAAYGEGAAQVIAFDQRTQQELAEVRQQGQAVAEQEEIEHQERINGIRVEYAESRAREQLEQTRRELDAQAERFRQIETLERTRYTELVNQVLNSALPEGERQALVLRLTFEADTNAIQREAIAIQEQIETVQQRLNDIAEGTAPAVSIGEYETLLAELEGFNLRRAELERQYTEVVQSEAQRRNEQRLQEAEGLFNTLGQTVSLLDGFQAAAFERETQANEDAQEQRQANIEDLQSQLEGASDAQKAVIEKRIKAEQEALRKLADEREALEEKEAKRQKGIAIVQSLIQTALNVVRALGTPPVPNIAAAALAGALGAAQTAIIAAQPAAEGALIGGDGKRIGLTLPQLAAASILSAKGAASAAYLASPAADGMLAGVPRLPNGVINVPSNIKPLSNGDNVLATVKRGEVVLNKRQQAALGGAPTFRAIQVPGFAEGGIAGSVIGAPDVAGISGQDRMRMLEEIAGQLSAGLSATNQRLDRLRVFVVSQDVRDDLAEGDVLKADATLG